MFTNTVAAAGLRCAGAVTARMELWRAWFVVLALHFTRAKDIPSNASYIVRHIDSCPDVGYFFQRDPAPNLVDRGPCFLCFCKENGTANCWERESRRCDVEKYHHHRVGRQSRYRRSFSDVFFRDATRDFFGKNLPEQCKPYESSFSDGCPPVDWCVGCTICDCDANGRWDCHILSFCDGKESKKKIKPMKNIRSKISKKSSDHETSEEIRSSKRAPTRKTSKKTTTKPKTTKPSKWNYRKVAKAKPGNKTTVKNKKSKNSTSKPKPSKKITRNAQTIAMSQSHAKHKVKIIKKIVSTRKPARVNRNAIKGMQINANNSETVKLGEKIVRQVMTTFKKMLAKQINKINETNRTKVMDGKDCGGVKKRDKRTYNVRSKAVARNKNKYNRQSLKENYTNPRRKRAILNQEHSNGEKISVITLTTPPDGNAVIPLETIKKHNNFSTNTPVNVTLISIITPQLSSYYEYSVKQVNNLTSDTELNINTISTTTTSPTTGTVVVTTKKENLIDNNFVVPVELSNDFSDRVKYNNTEATNPEFNDLKFSKWYVVKVKNEKKMPVTRIVLPKISTTDSLTFGKTTDKGYFNSKLHEQNLALKENPSQRNWSSHVSMVFKKPCCTKLPKTANETDLSGFKTIMQNLYDELNKTAAAKRKPKPKISVLKYVRKFFRKLFAKKKQTNHKYYGLGTREDHTLHLLCENIGPCKINKNSRMILKYKLNQLNQETNTVLKSIRTVKGLLHLLDLPDCVNISNTNSSFKNDIQKLGVVLKDYKGSDIKNHSLTFTQQTQIDYIKKNTQTFIQSVKKFADILTEVLSIIKPNADSVSTQKPPPRLRNNSMPFNKIKKILYQYNIIQNTFMKKMFELINVAEKRESNTETPRRVESSKNESNDKIIEKYSTNIIENLRKLKNIAQVLTLRRTKRDVTVRDDALEYLLTLMEVLIKKNQPLDTPPADDGIDLLIDAIRSAPEVKPIDQKYLSYMTHIQANKLIGMKGMNDKHISDSNSDSKRISNEENPSETDDNMITQDTPFIHDNAIQKDDVNQENRVNPEIEPITKPETLAIQTIDDVVTQKVYYRVFNQPANIDYETTTEFDVVYKKRINNGRSGLDKFESYMGESKKLENEPLYVEEDTVGEVTAETTPENMNYSKVTDRNVEKNTKAAPVRTTPFMSSKESSSESQDFSEKRSKLEWIEEAFDREIRMINNVSNLLPQYTSTETVPISTMKIIENNSDLTKEEHTNIFDTTMKSSKSAHDVYYEKQMQFLTSLDYGTEKSADVEVSESKDENRSDDAFPSYFV